jgi:hypothetical protein
MNMKTIAPALAALLISSQSLAQSQNLDSMKPTAPEAAPEAAPAGAEAPAADVVAPTDPAAAPSSAPSAAPESTAAEKTPVEKPIVQSALSKKLSDKLTLGTSIGFASVSGDGESWNALWNAQILMTYRLAQKIAGLSTAATFRFAPFDVTPRIDGRNYRGTVTGWLFGVEATKKLKERLDAVAGVELGFFDVNLDAIDFKALEASHEKNGFGLAVGGGVDYAMSSKILVGPRVRVGFGSMTVIEGSLALTTVF